MRHQICDTIEEAADYALRVDSQGVATYHACAAFRDRNVDNVRPDGDVWHQVRTHKNVRALKAFWMDLDVEPGNPKKFESQEAALDGLVAFCTTTKLPIPMIVSSGGGIHIYWTLTDEIIPEQWKPTAEGLKRLAGGLGFRSDPAVTSDLARVLRPVGTYNRKVPGVQRPVEIVADADPVDYHRFAELVVVAVKSAGLKPPEAVRKVVAPVEELNAAFAIKHDFPPCSAHRVADRCAQLRAVRDTKGQVSEPHWYAAIQLLCHALEGDELIHEWSKGHGNYSPDETSRKIDQVRRQALGPTLCTTFESRNPGGCDGCPFAGKISSPAQLGTVVPAAPPPVIEVEIDSQVVKVTLPQPPPPFTRGENGGVYIEEEGITHKIYEFDCFPTELAYDEQLGFETVRIRHFLPLDGWKECVIRSSLLAKPTDFEVALRDNHIKPLIRNKMTMFFDAYMRKLQTETKMRRLFKAQGWKNDDTEFVLGDKLFRPGEIVQAGFTHGTKSFLEHFRPRGSLATWRDLTSIFQTPHFEPMMFMLLMAFAAPLLKLDQRQGFTVSALGDTGVGKSTMGKFMASVYGHPDQTWIMRGSTANARAERIGAYHSLPAYMDEITTIAPKELRDLVYLISTGKWRESLTRDRTPREGAEWATILAVSTNDSLQSKLQLEKQNAEAESMRLFEFRFPRVPAFVAVAPEVHQVLAENYGVAGPEYIKRIVADRPRIKSEIHHVIESAGQQFGMDPKERFWSQAVMLALYGGKLAKEWGLIDFDPERLRPWLLSETMTMRRNLTESAMSFVQVFADYLNRHIGERLVVSKLNAGMTTTAHRPLREVSSRYERDINTLWVDRRHLKQDMDKNHFNYNDIKDDMVARGILIRWDDKKVLGSGTDFTGGQVICWKVKADHPELSGVLA